VSPETRALASLEAAGATILPNGRGPGSPSDPSPVSPYKSLFMDLSAARALPLVHSWASRLVADAMLVAKSVTNAASAAASSDANAARMPTTSAAAGANGAGRGPVKVGYLSRRFEKYPGTQLMLGLFGSHPRGRSTVVAFAHGPSDGSDERKVVAAASDAFVDLLALGPPPSSSLSPGGTAASASPAAAVESAALPHAAVLAQALDVLVDYDGMHDFNSVSLLAALEEATSSSGRSTAPSATAVGLGPGPVTATWLGFAGTGGLGRRTTAATLPHRPGAPKRQATAAKRSSSPSSPPSSASPLRPEVAVHGAGVVDYLIADGMVVDVACEPGRGYTESLALLPTTYQPQDELQGGVAEALGFPGAASRLELVTRGASSGMSSAADSPAAVGSSLAPAGWSVWSALRSNRGAAYGFAPGAVVLACLSRNNKVSPEAFDDWMAVMRRVPRAVLWLQAPHDEAPSPEEEAAAAAASAGGESSGESAGDEKASSSLLPLTVADRLRSEAASRGVHPARLVFAARSDRLECEPAVHPELPPPSPPRPSTVCCRPRSPLHSPPRRLFFAHASPC